MADEPRAEHPGSLTGPVRQTLARVDLATRALPRDCQQDVFELVEEAYHHGRAAGRRQAADALLQAADSTRETYVRAAFKLAARIAEAAPADTEEDTGGR